MAGGDDAWRGETLPVASSGDGATLAAAPGAAAPTSGDGATLAAAAPAPAASAAAPATPTSAAAALPIVERRHYHVLSEFARGGLGRILRARDKRTGRLVAIKEMLGGNEEVAARFAREALLTANLQHPAIVPVYELGRWPEGDPFYAMKLVSGRAFDRVLEEATTLDARLALLPTVLAMADAVAYAHGEGVIHRDLKPANVLVGSFSETVVIDWGLAKRLDDGSESRGLPALADAASALAAGSVEGQTVAGAVMGTPAYMPPEQARGEPVDARADVYSLGAILYQLLAGGPPFADARPKSVGELLALVAGKTPTPLGELAPGAPRDLVAVVAKAMARDPAARYPSAREMAEDLRRFTTGQLVGAHHYDRWTLLRRWLRRRRAEVTVAAVLLAVLGVTAGLSVRRIVAERERARHERARAQRGLSVALAEKGATAEAERRWSRAAMFYQAALAQADSAPVRYAAGRAETRMIVPQARYLGHQAWVHAVAVVGDDAVSVDETGLLRRWALADGGLVASFSAPAALYSVAASRDGASLAVGGDDGTVSLLDPGLHVTAKLTGHQGRIWGLAFSPDGQTVASAGEDASIRLWRGGTARELPGHTSRVYSVAFSPDAARLVSASDDRTVRVWDLAAGTSEVVLRPKAGARAAVFSPDGQRVMVTSWDWGIYVVDLVHPELGEARWGDSSSLHTIALSPDGSVIATGGDSASVKLWDPTTRAMLAVLDGHVGQVSSVAFSADGRRLVSAGRDGVPRVWDLGAVVRLATGVGHDENVSGLAFSRDGRRLASSSGDNTIRLWDVASGTALRRVSANGICHYGAFADADGGRFGGVCSNRIILWNAGDGHLERVIASDTLLLFTTLALDGSWIAAGHEGGKLHVWDLATGTLRAQRVAHEAPIYALRTLADGTLLTSSLDNTVKRWTAALEPLASWTAPVSDGLLDAAYDPSGRYLVASGNGPQLLRWQLSDGRSLAPLPGHTDTIWSVDFSPDGKLLASASSDGSIRLWNTDDWTATVLHGPAGAVRRVVFSPDGKLLASGHETGAVLLWDVATRRRARRLGAPEAGDDDGCDGLDRVSWHDADERALAARTCSEPRGAGLARLTARSHLVLDGEVNLVERWAP